MLGCSSCAVRSHSRSKRRLASVSRSTLATLRRDRPVERDVERLVHRAEPAVADLDEVPVARPRSRAGAAGFRPRPCHARSTHRPKCTSGAGLVAGDRRLTTWPSRSRRSPTTRSSSTSAEVRRYRGLEPDTAYVLDGVEVRTLPRPPGERLATVTTVNDVHFGETVCGMHRGHRSRTGAARPSRASRRTPRSMNRAAIAEMPTLDARRGGRQGRPHRQRDDRRVRGVPRRLRAGVRRPTAPRARQPRRPPGATFAAVRRPGSRRSPASPSPSSTPSIPRAPRRPGQRPTSSSGSTSSAPRRPSRPRLRPSPPVGSRQHPAPRRLLRDQPHRLREARRRARPPPGVLRLLRRPHAPQPGPPLRRDRRDADRSRSPASRTSPARGPSTACSKAGSSRSTAGSPAGRLSPWTDRTRAMFFGQYAAYSFGHLADRCFALPRAGRG